MNTVLYIRRSQSQLEKAERKKTEKGWIYEAVAAYGIQGLCEENCPIARGPKGKPFFLTREDIHFSISHSGEYWACAISVAPIGLDIQIHKEGKRDNLARRYFHEEEYRWLMEREMDGFFDVWAAKESYVKWSGRGIDGEFGKFSVVQNDGLLTKGAPDKAHPEKEMYFAHFKQISGYSMCICSEKEIDSVDIVWAG